MNKSDTIKKVSESIRPGDDQLVIALLTAAATYSERELLTYTFNSAVTEIRRLRAAVGVMYAEVTAAREAIVPHPDGGYSITFPVGGGTAGCSITPLLAARAATDSDPVVQKLREG